MMVAAALLWVCLAVPSVPAPAQPLARAAFLGDVASLQAALAGGAQVNQRGERDWTALHWAVIGGRADAAQALVERGADLNARGQFDLTPLHWAALLGQEQVLAVLLARGANLEARSLWGMTPLHLAATAKVVTALADAGAKLEQRDLSGLTPLFTVRSKEAGQTLLARGADLHARARDGRNLFDMLVVNTLEAQGLILYGRRSAGRLRGEDAKVDLQLLNVWPTNIEQVTLSAESTAAVVTAPAPLERLAPGQLGTASLLLRRRAEVAEGTSAMVVTVSVRGQRLGSFELELDTSRGETLADQGMVRLGQAKLRPTGGRGYEYALLLVPVLVLVGWLLARRRRAA